jgi:hypothetical protein
LNLRLIKTVTDPNSGYADCRRRSGKIGVCPCFFALVLALTGCAVVDQPYPDNWEPVDPPAASDCSHLQGSYADRGESAGTAQKPSLTRELFGDGSEWKEATRVQFTPSSPGNWDITVWHGEKKAYTRSLTNDENEVACSSGHLVVRNKRWVVSDLVSGQERVVTELSLSDGRLVARLTEMTYGLMFVIVPVAAESKRWYRFTRLAR